MAQAGRAGAVTIATNMVAGTDIILGGTVITCPFEGAGGTEPFGEAGEDHKLPVPLWRIRRLY